MRFSALVITALLACSAVAQSTSTFVFVKVTESIQPVARGQKYEDPLDAALKQAMLGEVTGGGSLLTKDRKIEWVGVDVELNNLMRGIPFLRTKLRELGAPKGSTLEYAVHGKKVVVPVHEAE